MINDFIKTKKFLCSVSFIAGVIMGYILGISHIGLRIINYFSNNLEDLLLPILNFTPSPIFLSDIVAFEAVIIGLAVPLSFEIVSRISERYKSEVLSKRFIQEWQIKWLPPFLIINIILAVLLRFFIHDDVNSTLWRVSEWIILIGFLIIAGILFSFLTILQRYMTDTNFTLKKLYDEAEKLLK